MRRTMQIIALEETVALLRRGRLREGVSEAFGTVRRADAQCAAGEILVSGGYPIEGANGGDSVEVRHSRPLQDMTALRVQARNPGAESAAWATKAYALCLAIR